LLQKESFYNSKFARTPQFYSDSGSVRPVWPLPDRLQDAPPVRPVSLNGLTRGVILIDLVPNLGANSFLMNKLDKFEVSLPLNWHA
jgi:hypothetical protein